LRPSSQNADVKSRPKYALRVPHSGSRRLAGLLCEDEQRKLSLLLTVDKAATELPSL
jgi:hypothetical protein